MYYLVYFSLICFLDGAGLKGKDCHLYLSFGGALTPAYNKTVSQSPPFLLPVSVWGK